MIRIKKPLNFFGLKAGSIGEVISKFKLQGTQGFLVDFAGQWVFLQVSEFEIL